MRPQPVSFDCKSRFFPFQKNPIKPSKTGQFPHRGPSLPLRYAQDTKTPLEGNLYRGNGLRAASIQPRRKDLRELNSVEDEIVMAESREVMNIRQASQYLGVSPDTLYKYVNEQKIPAFKLGNRWRFKKSKLDQWMEEQSMETEGSPKKKAKAAVKAAGQQ
ncbi:MAG TPA: helix-turn-helix domain-containing protein [Terriglobales bacterium]|nr:helix-turn-helix domain-containing protein [Terriglobales bacterium]